MDTIRDSRIRAVAEMHAATAALAAVNPLTTPSANWHAAAARSRAALAALLALIERRHRFTDEE